MKRRTRDESAIFKKFYPDGSLERITLDDLPAPALIFFEGKSEVFIHPSDYREGNFEAVYRIQHPVLHSFVATQTKTYDTCGDTERLTYVADMAADGDMLGYLELRFNISNPSPFFHKRPFVGFNRTHEEFRQQGFGLRRLRVANALAHAFYGLPLHCSDSLQPSAKSLWLHLVENGEAVRYDYNDRDRFRFIRTTTFL